MATGGSEETFDFICTPCSKVSSHSEAVIYCVECRECFCQTCYEFHQKIAALVVHKVLDKAGMQAGGAADMTSLPTDTCDTHPGKLIVVYCKDHDALCCVECIAKDHRPCPNAVYITETATGFKDSSQLKDLTSSTNGFIDEVDELKVSKQTNLNKTQLDKNGVLTEIHNVTDDLVQRIKYLEKVSVDMVTECYEPIEKALQTQLKDLDDLNEEAKSVLTSLSPANVNEAQLFINGQQGKKKCRNMTKKFQQKVPKDKKSDELDFMIKSRVKQIVSGLDEMQSMVTIVKTFKANLHGNYSVKLSTDIVAGSTIYGSSFLCDGTMVASDYSNKRIIHLDTSYRVKNICDLSSCPWGVTLTVPNEIAVSMTALKKVQFVSTGASMSLTGSFSTNDCCRGVCYNKDELFVSCGGLTNKGFEEGPGYVAVYNLRGAHLRTIQTGTTGQNLFSCPYHISISTDGNRVFVADPISGIVSIDRKGKNSFSFSYPSLKQAFGVCTLDNGHILVSAVESNNVLQIDVDGRKVAELLSDTDGVNDPKSLCYDSNRSRLVLTMGKTDIIKVFDLI